MDRAMTDTDQTLLLSKECLADPEATDADRLIAGYEALTTVLDLHRVRQTGRLDEEGLRWCCEVHGSVVDLSLWNVTPGAMERNADAYASYQLVGREAVDIAESLAIMPVGLVQAADLEYEIDRALGIVRGKAVQS